MILLRYFNIGTGVTRKYTGVPFISSIESISPYVSNTSNELIDDNKGAKKQKNEAKGINKKSVQTFFCPEHNCCISFGNVTDLEDHIDAGDHSIIKVKKVKSGFVRRMKCQTMLLKHMVNEVNLF